jgi:hypothetical protein
MRGGRSTVYADGAGRRWRVRELLRSGDSASRSDQILPVTATLVFESRGERRFVDGAPLDWRDRRSALGELFASALPLQRSSGANARSTPRGLSPGQGERASDPRYDRY